MVAIGVEGSAHGVSADGSTIVGKSGDYAFRWTIDGGKQVLGDLPGGAVSSYASGVSADGSTVVGWSQSSLGEEGFIWDELNGMRPLRDELSGAGIDMSGWTLQGARGVSDDGNTIVGFGLNPDGNQEAWIVRSTDTDGDQLTDLVDPDDDDDGFLDGNDAFPLDPTEWLDTDNDGTGNNADADDDDDGLTDAEELSLGTNPLDDDSDDDTFSDGSDVFPLDPAEWLDTDNDGTGNVADPDDDNDSYADTEDAFPLDHAEWLDTDEDGVGNNADTDDDDDGVSDDVDAFPLDLNEWLDTDNDSMGDNSDPDDDNDGLSDAEEISLGTNPLLVDTDGDGLSDSWEVGIGRFSIVAGSFTWQQARADAHSKGGELASFPTEDRWELAIQSLGPNALDSFTGVWIGVTDEVADGDWLWVNGETFSFSSWATDRPSATPGNTLDYVEVSGGGGAEIYKWYDRTSATVRDGYILETSYATDPNVADVDDDGLNDSQELAAGTNPFLADTDDDGLTDGQEVNLTHTNPLLKNTDGIDPDDGEEDPDEDDLTNFQEVNQYGTDPLIADTDEDGINDRDELGLARFELVIGIFNYAQAEAEAALRDGYLATFKDEVEYQDAFNQIGNDSLNLLTGVWIGATDSAEEGVWRWGSGEPFNYSNWGASRPSIVEGNTLDYAEISGGEGAEIGKWYDRSATMVRDGYLLEKSFVSNPTLADTDGDGLDDLAERNAGTLPTVADTDGDGFHDGAEVEFDGDPLDSSRQAKFQIHLSVIDLGAATIQVRFPTQVGASYSIESSNKLNEWNTVENDIIGEGGVVTRFYSFENQPKWYFRARRN